MSKNYNINGKNIEVSNADKVFFPKSKISKKDLIEYYQNIFSLIEPHLKDRPISMERCPDGINEDCFYHKKAPDYFPSWIEQAEIRIKEEKSYQNQVVINNKATLIYLVDQGMITPHSWLAKKDAIYKPDKIIFDLDPPKNNFDLVRLAAKKLKNEFEKNNLKSFVMTTGSKGLHVVIPIKPLDSFKKIREFSKQVANDLANKYSDKFTTKPSKDKRKGRLFLDYLRNSYGQTSVVPYAIRAIKGAPIATPIRWDEIDMSDLNPQKYTIKNILKRTSKINNPWQDYQKVNNIIKL